MYSRRKSFSPNTTAKTGNRGFTLIEIMVVMVILGLLAVLIVPNVIGRPDEARIVKATQDVRTLHNALKLYRLDNYSYPSQAQGLDALTTAPSDASNWSGPYIESLPQDPWGNPYQYANPSKQGQEIDIFSLGADNAVGGEGNDADIGNWTSN